MNKKIVIFSDLDGTALNDNHEFDVQTIKTVEQIYNQGHYFIPITARCTIDALERQSKTLNIDKFNGIIVANNGSQIYDFKTKQFIISKYIDKEIIKKVFELTFGKVGKYKVHYFSDNTNFVYGPGENSKFWSDVMQINYKVVQNVEEINESINHMTVILEKNPTAETISIFLADFMIIEDEIDIIKYTDRVYELTTKGINKGFAVQKILEYLSLDDTNSSVYCFGDSFNDIEMFKKIKNSVAMENAIDELKIIAADKTLSNNDCGVANYINKKILGGN